MSLSRLKRVSAFCCMTAGIFVMASTIWAEGLCPVESLRVSTACVAGSGLNMTGSLLLTVGLIGVYLAVAEATGRFGLVAFVMALLGIGLHAGAGFKKTFIGPVLAEQVPSLFYARPLHPLFMAASIADIIPFILGSLLFGISLLRTQIFPRWVVLLYAGPIVLFPLGVPSFIAKPLYGLGVTFLGYLLWSKAADLPQGALAVPK